MKAPKANPCTCLAQMAARMEDYRESRTVESGWVNAADQAVDDAMAEIMEAGPVVDDFAKQKELRCIIGKLFNVLIEISAPAVAAGVEIETWTLEQVVEMTAAAFLRRKEDAKFSEAFALAGI